MTRARADLRAIVDAPDDRALRRRLAWTIAAVVVGLGVWLFFGGGGPDPVARFVVDPASRADIVVTVTATGTVAAKNTVEISSELSGTIRTVHADYNDKVARGQPLAELDRTTLEATVASSRATVAGNAARLAQAQATLDQERREEARTVSLSAQGIGTDEQLVAARAELRRAEAAADAAAADLEVSKANLALDEADLAKACICSPIDGVVMDRSVEAGQIVAASLSAPVLFTLAEDLSKMELLVDIDEADIGMVAVGDPATFTVEAYQDRVFPATILQVRYASETVDGVVTYKAVLDIDNAELLLRPGMTAVAEITVDDRQDVLTVANAALRYAPPAKATAPAEGGGGLLGLLVPPRPSEGDADREALGTGSRRTLYVLKDGVPAAVPVRTGPTDGTRTEIVEGALAEGDAVILSRDAEP